MPVQRRLGQASGQTSIHAAHLCRTICQTGHQPVALDRHIHRKFADHLHKLHRLNSRCMPDSQPHAHHLLEREARPGLASQAQPANQTSASPFFLLVPSQMRPGHLLDLRSYSDHDRPFPHRRALLIEHGAACSSASPSAPHDPDEVDDYSTIVLVSHNLHTHALY